MTNFESIPIINFKFIKGNNPNGTDDCAFFNFLINQTETLPAVCWGAEARKIKALQERKKHDQDGKTHEVC